MFPHPCTHCGLCCIAIVCPIGMALMRISKQGPCPALEWEEDNPDASRCGLIANPEKYLPPQAHAIIQNAPEVMPLILGSGTGCCIKARVIVNGTETDFAALPPETKTEYTRGIRANQIPLFSSQP